MLTTWDQVESWIRDNGLRRWIFFKEKPQGDKKDAQKIIDSSVFTVSDEADKIAMSEKYLRLSGGRAWAAGYGKSDGEIVTEIRLADEAAPAAPTQGVSGYPSIGELTETITKQVRAEMAVEDFKRREKDLEQREKDFNEKQNGVIGALVGVFAPYLPVMNQIAGMRKVAGVDASAPVKAQPIIPEEQPQETQEPEDVQEPSAWDAFTDEEGNEIIELMARFKAVEPNYLPMIRKVVEMAESGDKTYAMAKNFLI